MFSKITFVSSLCCLIFFALSCNKSTPIVEDPIPTPEEGGIEDVNVPNGFDFSVTTNVEFNLNFYDDNNALTDSVSYTILGVNTNDNTEVLFSGKSKDKTSAQFTLPIPNHFKAVVIKTDHKNDIKYFEYAVNKTIHADLIVRGFTANSGDTRSNNCYPTINNTFNEFNTGFTVTSDQTMTTIEITYTDGTTETVTVNGTSYTK